MADIDTEAIQQEKEDILKLAKKNKYRKDKPWDTVDIDKWKVEPFNVDPSTVKPFLEESSFATLFPKYREQYLKLSWSDITKELKKYGVSCELNLIEGYMLVKTTRQTMDPYIILKARDLIKLLSRSVTWQQAIKILQDDMACDIIKIGSLVRRMICWMIASIFYSRERFVKRRQRLLGPDGNTLKAIELLTKCYVLVQGNTVSVMGSYKGLKEVRRIIEDCMKNIHPIYHIKELMIKRELMKDSKLVKENWNRFLPKFRKQPQPLLKKAAKKGFIHEKKKKDYTPFPPAQPPRKIDLQMESGEYFLQSKEREKEKIHHKKEKQSEAKVRQDEQRQQAFIPPKEDQTLPQTKKRKLKNETNVNTFKNVNDLKMIAKKVSLSKASKKLKVLEKGKNSKKDLISLI